jgi:hypothetical protein
LFADFSTAMNFSLQDGQALVGTADALAGAGLDGALGGGFVHQVRRQEHGVGRAIRREFHHIIHAAALDGDLDAGFGLEGLGDDVQAAIVGEARCAHDDLAGRRLGAGRGGKGEGRNGNHDEVGFKNSHHSLQDSSGRAFWTPSMMAQTKSGG